jgi:adenosylcobyric acid synthase
MAGSLLIAGTTSDAGKSVVTTALCRAFARRGVKVAPFKAQNMSNNSMVCGGTGGAGGEIGRAQWVQAIAAGVEPEPAMNPVLLKPSGDRRSHVVVLGRPAGTIDANDFMGGREPLKAAAFEAVDQLRQRYDVVLCEGAGSPAEINLREWDYVNMGLARHLDAPTVVVGDIDRGGVFAALYGTVLLLDEEDRRLIAGFIMNKFRGDLSLLQPGIDELRERTGRPTFGVLPWYDGLWIDSEDAQDLARRSSEHRDGPTQALRVGVIRLPRISNFTDVDALGLEPGVDLRFASDPRDIAECDLVVLPGTRSTIADLDWLRSRGLDEAISGHVAAGRSVLGICGGAQMLGRSIADPSGVEGRIGVVAGLGLIDIATTFSGDKVLELPSGVQFGTPVSGYEIHHGRLDVGEADSFVGGARSGNVYATMWHGAFESDDFRRAFLRRAAAAVGRQFASSDMSFARARDQRIDLLADLAEEHLDVAALLELAQGAPQ